MNHDFGVNPPNQTTPQTFIHGKQLLKANVSTFVCYEETQQGVGVAQVSFLALDGSFINNIPSNHVSPSLSFILDSGDWSGNVPDGYDYGIDGVLDSAILVPVESTTFAQVKKLCR